MKPSKNLVCLHVPSADSMCYVSCASCNNQFWILKSEGNLIAHAAAGDLLSLSTSTYLVHQTAPFGGRPIFQ